MNGSIGPIIKMHSPQVPKGSGYGMVQLPPYCAPIQELQDENAPPTPKNTRGTAPNVLETNSADNLLDLSSPNSILGEVEGEKDLLNPPSTNGTHSNGLDNSSSIATSSSEQTLLEENLSGYCEPFGKAVLVPGGAPSTTNSASSRDNLLAATEKVASNSGAADDFNEIDIQTRLSNAESELEAIVSQMTPISTATSNQEYSIQGESCSNNNEVVNGGNGDANNVAEFTKLRIKNTELDGSNRENLQNGNNSRYVDKCVDEEDLISVLQNGDKSNGNTTYGGVVLKSTLRRKTPPKSFPMNGQSKPKKLSRPIPPPKPKKTLTSLKRYQDESIDGSEV